MYLNGEELGLGIIGRGFGEGLVRLGGSDDLDGTQTMCSWNRVAVWDVWGNCHRDNGLTDWRGFYGVSHWPKTAVRGDGESQGGKVWVEKPGELWHQWQLDWPLLASPYNIFLLVCLKPDCKKHTWHALQFCLSSTQEVAEGNRVPVPVERSEVAPFAMSHNASILWKIQDHNNVSTTQEVIAYCNILLEKGRHLSNWHFQNHRLVFQWVKSKYLGHDNWQINWQNIIWNLTASSWRNQNWNLCNCLTAWTGWSKELCFGEQHPPPYAGISVGIFADWR